MPIANPRWIVIACAFTAVFLVVETGAAQPAHRPEFEVASIHEVPRSKGKFRILTSDLATAGSRFTLTTSLKGLIEVAYSVKDVQVSGPVWLDANAFQIEAKTVPDTPDGQLRLMCQSLLADRFGLIFHHDAKQQLVYALVPGKNGPKLTASAAANSAQENAAKIKSKPGRIASARASMPWLAEALSRQLGRPVLDKTDIPGDFRILLNWTPVGEDAQSAKFAKPAKGEKSDKDPSASIFTAIQEQLGLRLESQRSLVDTLVVDHINHSPTAN